MAGNNTGDGIRMAMEMGADLWHMWHYHSTYGFVHPDQDYPYAMRTKRLPDWVPKQTEAPHVEPQEAEPVTEAGAENKAVPMSWIILDQDGERYMNEYQPYLQDTGARQMGTFDANRQKFPRNPSYLICDEDGRKRYKLGDAITNDPDISYSWSEDNSKEVEIGILKEANTVSGLAEALDLPRQAVEKSISRWNNSCEKGKDGDFGRPPGSMEPITNPPYYGAEVWSVVSNTQGGPAHNSQQQIIKATGEPIPRLFSAGEMGSIYGHLYLSGGNIAECVIAGRIAGQNVSDLQIWE
jgi:succinate dehydrogenase/fumarate reductase flavoprotein subunit